MTAGGDEARTRVEVLGFVDVRGAPHQVLLTADEGAFVDEVDVVEDFELQSSTAGPDMPRSVRPNGQNDAIELEPTAATLRKT